MKNLTVLIAALLLSACASTAPTKLSKALIDDEVLEMVVPVGSVDVFDLDFTPSAEPIVGNRTVVEVQVGNHPRQYKTIPLKKGATSVVFSDEAGKVRRRISYKVVTNDLFTRYEAVRYLLRNVRGVLVEIVDNRILIDGKVENEADREKVLTVQAAYYDVVLNLAANSENLCATRNCFQAASFDDPVFDAPLELLPYSGPEEAAFQEKIEKLREDTFAPTVDLVNIPNARAPASTDPIVEAVRKATAELIEKKKKNKTKPRK